MLSAVLAHAGQPLAPQDLGGAWNVDPLLVGGLALTAGAYWQGTLLASRTKPGEAWRRRAFWAASATIAIALVSPLDALSGVLASAHMVQHVLLILVAAPLLTLSAPMTTLLRGSPAVVRDASLRCRRGLRLTRANLRPLRHPVSVWLLHAGTLWFWHSAVPYEAAVEHHAVHAVEHASFLVSGVLFWRVVLGARAVDRVPPGLGVLLVFAMAMQSGFLSALLTFAETPWYSVYAATTPAWGLDPLADQQLSGVIMWIPAGLLYVAAGLGLFVTWIRASEQAERAV